MLSKTGPVQNSDFCVAPPITICIHQETNPGQQSVLSSSIQSEQRWCLQGQVRDAETGS